MGWWVVVVMVVGEEGHIRNATIQYVRREVNQRSKMKEKENEDIVWKQSNEMKVEHVCASTHLNHAKVGENMCVQVHI
jgi:hypothetical protein